MRFVVMTVAREGTHYLYDTVENFGLHEQLCLVVGSAEQSYVDRYRNNSNFRIISADDYSHLAALPLYKRAVWNYWRCLDQTDATEDALVMEDDIKFSIGWYPYLLHCLERAKKRHHDFAMTLYVPNVSESGNVRFSFPLDAYKKGEAFAYYDMSRFYGTQAVVFSTGIQHPFRDYLKANLLGDRPTDYLLRAFCNERKIPILATAPCLVQHMGLKTTGLQGRTHQSACFLEAVCLPRGRTVAVVTKTWTPTSAVEAGTGSATKRVQPALRRRIPRR